MKAPFFCSKTEFMVFLKRTMRCRFTFIELSHTRKMKANKRLFAFGRKYIIPIKQ